jgi:hypothetical protein
MTYKGIDIYRNEGGGMTGARLRYWAFIGPDNDQIAANTIQDMKQLITEKLEEGKCKWFLRCTNDAVTTEKHPILGDVPICQRCKDKVERIAKGR